MAVGRESNPLVSDFSVTLCLCAVTAPPLLLFKKNERVLAKKRKPPCPHGREGLSPRHRGEWLNLNLITYLHH